MSYPISEHGFVDGDVGGNLPGTLAIFHALDCLLFELKR